MNEATNASAGCATSSAGVPVWRSVPSTITPTWSASAAASSKSCVTSSTGMSSPASSSCSSARTVVFVCASSADERLVEQQHLRVARERARERDALALAAGEPAGPRVARGARCRSARGSSSAACLPRVLDVLRARSCAGRARSPGTRARRAAARAAGRRARPRRTRRRRRPRSGPRCGRASPATARSTRRLARRRTARRARRVEPTSRRQLEVERPKRDGDVVEDERCHVSPMSEAGEEDDADEDEHAAHRERRVEVRVELGVDRERQRLRHLLQAAGEHDRRAELAEPARERQREPGDQPAARERQHDAEERARRAGAERPRGGGEVRVGRLERGDRLADVERARDVRDGDRDGASA